MLARHERISSRGNSWSPFMYGCSLLWAFWMSRILSFFCQWKLVIFLCTEFFIFNPTMQLSPSEIKEIYGTRHIGRDQARGLVGLMDFFCFSEVCQLLPPPSSSMLCHSWTEQVGNILVKKTRVMNASCRFASEKSLSCFDFNGFTMGLHKHLHRLWELNEMFTISTFLGIVW